MNSFMKDPGKGFLFGIRRVFFSCFRRIKRANYWLVYSVIWLVTALLVFSSILFTDRSFVGISDGFTQHYVALKYYGIYLRRIFRELIQSHRLVIPDWDFCIGEGGDILTTLHYYCIGDPLSLLSFFVPAAYTHYLYTFLGLLRLYLSGVSFSCLAFGTGRKNKYGVLSGALSYSLCYWGIACACGHPFFVNPMIYFPLMILGIEHIIKNNRFRMFIIVTAILAASNLYFFYVTALLTVFYALIRIFLTDGPDIGSKLKTIATIGGYAIIGVCISGAVFFPVAMSYIGDSRLSVSQPFHFFYPLFNYTALPASMISATTSYATIALAIPVLIATLLIVFSRDDNKPLTRLLRIFLLVTIVFALFPVFGRMFNLMSYMTNRWVFAFNLLCSYILSYEWDNLRYLKFPEFIKIFISGMILFGLCIILTDSRLDMAFAMLVLFFITLMILILFSREISCFDHAENRTREKYNLGMLFITVLSVILFGIWVFSPSFNNGAASQMSNDKVLDKVSSTGESLFCSEFNTSNSDDSSVIRASGRDLSRNANILNNFSSTQYYWSMSNPYMTGFRSSMELPDPSVYSYTNYDDRTALTALASVQYYITKEGNSVGIPYGFVPMFTKNTREKSFERYTDLLKEEMSDEPTSDQLDYLRNYFYEPYTIYNNEYALPLAYCYDSYINKAEYEALDPVSREQVCLDTCVTNVPVSSVNEYDKDAADYRIPCEIRCNSDEIMHTDTGFISTAYNTSVTLNFDSPSNSETYIRISGLNFKQTAGYDLYFGDDSVDPMRRYNKIGYKLLTSDEKQMLLNERKHMRYDDDVTISVVSESGLSKSFNFRQAEAPFSSGRHDYIVNMGYSDEPQTSITLSFPLRGIYSIENIEIFSIPINGYAEKIEKLKSYTLDDMIMDTDSISGTTELPSPRILTLAVPFSKGWNAYIDASKVSVFPVNEHYIGIEAPSGNHTILFRYSTPYKYHGAALSLIGILLFAAITQFCRRVSHNTDK